MVWLILIIQAGIKPTEDNKSQNPYSYYSRRSAKPPSATISPITLAEAPPVVTLQSTAYMPTACLLSASGR